MNRRCRESFLPFRGLAASWLILAILVPTLPGTASDRSIHVFAVFCNAYEGESGAINQGVTGDKYILDKIFTEYFSQASWDVELHQTVVEGEQATLQGIEDAFAGAIENIGPDDTVYVHFSGHGVIRDPTEGEQFLQTVDERLLSREKWAEQIERLPARLRILITDCCSSYPPEFVIAEGDEPVKPWSNLYYLLMEHEGFVNLTAASPGQMAYGSSVGGFFTINLESDLQRYPTWEQVFAATRSRVQEETTAQIARAGLGGNYVPQEPFAYSLGSPTAAAKQAAEVSMSADGQASGPGVVATRSPGLPAGFEYVLPDSAERRLGRDELVRMGLQQLYLARNEIFARHGYDFNSSFLEDYFSSRSWYEKRPGFKNPDLSSTESRNVALILEVEKELGGPFISSRPSMPGDGGGGAPAEIFVYSSERTLSRSVLQNLTPRELSIARNEIYARHGYPFRSKALRSFFSRKPDYVPVPGLGEPDFSPVEEHNLWLIRKIERIKGGAYRW